jgi:YggT family protein
LESIGVFIQIFSIVLIAAIFIRIIFSWTGFDPSNPIYEMIFNVTEPILGPIRSVMPRMGMLDLTPMAAIFLLFMLMRLGQSLAAT